MCVSVCVLSFFLRSRPTSSFSYESFSLPLFFRLRTLVDGRACGYKEHAYGHVLNFLWLGAFLSFLYHKCL